MAQKAPHSVPADCLCCHLAFNILRWQYPCDGCRQPVCRACCRKLVHGMAGHKVTYLCDMCVGRGILIRANCLEAAGDMGDLLVKHRRETAQLCREYSALHSFSEQLECALRRKSEAVSELQDLALVTPRFAGNPEESFKLSSCQARRVELSMPSTYTPCREDKERRKEEDAPWIERCLSLGGQSTASTRKSGEGNWEELCNWEDQNDRIGDLQRQIENLKKQNAELQRREEHLEGRVKAEKETKQRDFERFVKVDMKCMKLETELLEAVGEKERLALQNRELQEEVETLRANLHSLKSVFEADKDESELRIRQLEETQGWFAGRARPSARGKGEEAARYGALSARTGA